MLAEQLVAEVRKLDPADREPVVKSILMSAGPDVEERVLRKDAELSRMGMLPEDALVQALEHVLKGPDGPRILRVLAVAGAVGAQQRGLVKSGKLKAAIPKLEQVLQRSDELGDFDDGLGFGSELIGPAITLGTQILAFGIGAIKAAVHKARDKRRKQKRQVKELTDEEIAQVIVEPVTRFASFTEALPAIKENIAILREGRRSFIIKPDQNDPKHNVVRGAQIDEEKQVAEAFWGLRKVYLQRQHAAEVKKKQINDGLVVGGIVLGGVALLGVTWYALG